MKKRILITGGSGLLALNWAISLRRLFDVILGLHSRQINLAGTKSMMINMESVDSIKKLLNEVKPDLIIHTAGLTNIEHCESLPDLARYANFEISANLSSACASLGVQLVYISTDHLFHGGESFTDETAPVLPLNVYGRTKARGEVCVLDICPNALVIRTNFYCWGTSYRYSFTDLIINTLRSGKKIKLFNDIFYSPILCEELILATHDLLNKNAAGIFNIVSDERISKYDFGLIVAQRFNLDTNLIEKGSINDEPNLVIRPRDMSLSNKKASQLLGRKIGNVFEHLKKLKKQEDNLISQELQTL